ncbi:hypothetical protein [Roseovarius salinarum]|uniref:hypothetical protein n=1 Tax=Roseovarius salinarum TaxID=1981892 RepID=UPI000C322C69|nr:hypothetical protein [Roseovarius salinarum]
MRFLLTLFTISALALAGCSSLRDSRVNPANWFGKSKSEPRAEQTEQAGNPLIPENEGEGVFSLMGDKDHEGTPVAQVTGLEIKQVSGGAIVRVQGITRRQGAHDVRLASPTEGEPVDGVLTLRLEAAQPEDTAIGPERTRVVNAARFIPERELRRTRSVRVIAETNVRTSRR